MQRTISRNKKIGKELISFLGLVLLLYSVGLGLIESSQAQVEVNGVEEVVDLESDPIPGPEPMDEINKLFLVSGNLQLEDQDIIQTITTLKSINGKTFIQTEPMYLVSGDLSLESEAIIAVVTTVDNMAEVIEEEEEFQILVTAPNQTEYIEEHEEVQAETMLLAAVPINNYVAEVVEDEIIETGEEVPGDNPTDPEESDGPPCRGREDRGRGCRD